MFYCMMHMMFALNPGRVAAGECAPKMLSQLVHCPIDTLLISLLLLSLYLASTLRTLLSRWCYSSP